jgi:hypothetical protein
VRWSYSLHRSMRRCQRAMAFQHIVASATANSPERREAYILKQLRGISTWQGSVLHTVLASTLVDLLRTGRPLMKAPLAAAAHDLASNQFAFSAARRYHQAGVTKQSAGAAYCALMEHEKGLEVTEAQLNGVHAVIDQCLDNLMSQQEFLNYLQQGSAYVPERAINFRIGPTLATATPDLVFRTRRGGSAVIDWKIAASETSDYSPQLRVYALALARVRAMSPEDIARLELFEVNLLRNEIHHEVASSELVEETEDFVFRSTMELQDLVGSGHYAELDLDDLDVAGSPGSCSFCPFSTMCVEALERMVFEQPAEPVQGSLL